MIRPLDWFTRFLLANICVLALLITIFASNFLNRLPPNLRLQCVFRTGISSLDFLASALLMAIARKFKAFYSIVKWANFGLSQTISVESILCSFLSSFICFPVIV